MSPDRAPIRVWIVLLDDARAPTRIISRRPFVLPWEADSLALAWKDDLGFGDRVRYLRTGE